jgi:hypothetical protein
MTNILKHFKNHPNLPFLAFGTFYYSLVYQPLNDEVQPLVLSHYLQEVGR